MINIVDKTQTKKVFPSIPFIIRDDREYTDNKYWLVCRDCDTKEYLQVGLTDGQTSATYETLEDMFSDADFLHDVIIENATITIQ